MLKLFKHPLRLLEGPSAYRYAPDMSSHQCSKAVETSIGVYLQNHPDERAERL
jgi:hypothetical protein